LAKIGAFGNQRHYFAEIIVNTNFTKLVIEDEFLVDAFLFYFELFD